MTTPEHTNALISETSPYLLQHAHNPVNWQAWNDKSLEQARKEDKLIIISVGYSACHWCHVMEHESFEDEAVAEIMNEHYINIKVDREERPDVDQVYMNAVQIMTGRGGWPMNIIALPDGRPVWGGTYFPKEQWMSALKQIANLYKEDKAKMLEYAQKLEEGLKQLQLIKFPETESGFTREFLNEVIQKWKNNFDHEFGGSKGAPKFMIPNNYNFLMRSAFQEEDEGLMRYVTKTLDKISYGGVYDHVGGGFSRYSVDERWHVPHFEKMLYDNAQLVSLYSQAFLLTKNNWYKEVVEQSLDFIREELTDSTGAFYSAWDADSPNASGKQEEGAYYVWTKNDLQEILKEDFEIFSAYYNINSYGKWEDEKYVLIRTKSNPEIAEEFDISEKELKEKKRKWLNLLKNKREERKKPGLDDKSLTSWNALMLTGYVDAYKAFSKDEYLITALKNAEFIKSHQLKEKNNLLHSYKNGKSSINGYLEDYALTIEAFINLYEVTLNQDWLMLSRDLTEACFTNFYNKETSMFYFTSKEDRALITRTFETTDNVIPASNSIMAKSLFKLGKHFGEKKYSETAKAMLKTIQPQIKSYPSGYSNWLDLMLNFTHPFYEIAITGEEAQNLNSLVQTRYLPNKITAGSTGPEELPLVQNRFKDGQNLIYICTEGACQQPTESVEDALNMIKRF